MTHCKSDHFDCRCNTALPACSCRFGKVMQVKHKQSGAIYAMKILKKTELRRRRQVNLPLIDSYHR